FEENNNYIIDFIEGANCIYGDNGTGKTSIINLIVSSLKCDLSRLKVLPFGNITLYTAKTGQVRAKKFLNVERKQPSVKNGNFESGYIRLEVTNDSEPLTIPYYNQFQAPWDEIDSSIMSKLDLLKNHISSELTLTHVPLLRIHDSEIFGETGHDDYLQMALRKKKINQNQISEIMDPSFRVISSIQSQFTEEINYRRKEITSSLESLKSRIIEKVMIDQKLITQSKSALRSVSKVMNSQDNIIDTNSYFKKLKDANIDVPEDKVKEHFMLWSQLGSKCREEYNDLQNYKNDGNVKDSEVLRKSREKFNNTYMTLFSITNIYDRFLSIVDDVENMQNKKEQIWKIFTDYENEVNSYIGNYKSFKLTEDGDFIIKSNNRRIKLQDLSSGEKHIITILGRATLSNKNGAVFVADEPELSLHLDWQRKILNSIKKLSPLSQIIVATHSPAIFTKGINQINLEDCQ
ncbi:TPA: AAA family ATPase, partial [Providencia rettgeri]|nr:AAA family ATPase [Providencia rettgeri]